MYLSRLLISHFKNIENTSLDFSSKINVLYGDNGEGKTNLLDAIYYLGVCKSFFAVPDREIITHSCDLSTLYGEYAMGSGLTEKIACSLTRQGEKLFKRNGKTYERLSMHVGLIPVVMVSPQDTSLVFGTGDERRRYMNFLLSQTDPGYLQTVLEYKKWLFQRNRVLKTDTAGLSVLEAIDAGLCQRGDEIHSRRAELCRLLHPYVVDFYSQLSGNKEQIDLCYESDLNKDVMAALLRKNEQKDRTLQYTTVGVQRDDVLFSLNGYPLKVCGSQGQQKTFLLALKLAQFALIRQLKGMAPILLLDDVFDKLDAQRVSFLLRLVVRDHFGQIFLTDSNKVRLEETLTAIGGDHCYYHVREGVFTNEKTRNQNVAGRS